MGILGLGKGMIENQELGELVHNLRDENARLNVMIRVLRENGEQTYRDFKEELGIARERYLNQGTRADELEKQKEQLKELAESRKAEIERLNHLLHRVRGDLAIAYGLLQLIAPDEEALQMLSHYDENTQLLSWPCLLSVGVLRETYQAVKLLEEHRRQEKEKAAA